jgi:DNA repair exonuclease SbcCD ATPase subunit
MGNDKYLNHYVEILTSTMTDCVVRNVSMQANAKITDEVVKEQTEQIVELVKLNDELKETVQQLKQTNSTNENNVIQELRTKLTEAEKLVSKQSTDINELTNKHRVELEELNTKFRDYESVKNQATHVETFKGELIRAREETNRVRTELDNRINSINAENTGKIDGINQENDKNVKLLTQKHETEKSNLNDTIKSLTEKIEYLQLPPAKRKKIEEQLNKEVAPTAITSLVGADGELKDGGSF